LIPGDRLWRLELTHPIDFASKKLSKVEKNYTTIEMEWLAMGYALHNFRHYLLGWNFKMFTDHSSLKYLFNQIVLGGNICRWLLFSQDYDFEVVVKWGILTVGLDNLSRLEIGEEPMNIEDNLPDVQLFAIRISNDHLADINKFLTIGMVPS